MAINYKKLGKRISFARIATGMTQEDLAERVNCSPSYISYIETGSKHVSMDYFVRIANVLGCTADELLIDQLEKTLPVKSYKFAALLQDCEEFEQQIIFEMISAAKGSIRKYARSAKSSKR